MVIVSSFTQGEVNNKPYPGWLAKPVLVSSKETRKDQTVNSATATPTTMASTCESKQRYISTTLDFLFTKSSVYFINNMIIALLCYYYSLHYVYNYSVSFHTK